MWIITDCNFLGSYFSQVLTAVLFFPICFSKGFDINDNDVIVLLTGSYEFSNNNSPNTVCIPLSKYFAHKLVFYLHRYFPFICQEKDIMNNCSKFINSDFFITVPVKKLENLFKIIFR